jgi:hypothetical protein
MNFKRQLLLAATVLLVSAACGRPTVVQLPPPPPVNSSPPVNAGTPPSAAVTVKGTLVPGGVECPRFKGEDGKYYTLAPRSKLNGFKEGDTLIITGTRAEISFCMQDIVLDVSQVTKAPVISDSGIIGTMTIGPTCPAMRDPPDPGCNDKSYQGTVVIKSADGREAARVTADGQGVFKVAVAPGTYTVEPINSNIYPRASAQTVQVAAHAFTKIAIQYDSGIR